VRGAGVAVLPTSVSGVRSGDRSTLRRSVALSLVTVLSCDPARWRSASIMPSSSVFSRASICCVESGLGDDVAGSSTRDGRGGEEGWGEGEGRRGADVRVGADTSDKDDSCSGAEKRVDPYRCFRNEGGSGTDQSAVARRSPCARRSGAVVCC